MAIHDQFAFEVTANEGIVLVRSIESISRVYLRFTNRTSRPVNVYWRDFSGIRQRYVSLAPGHSRDINTYLTHPWEFVDKVTKEVYAINNKPIFRAPANLGGMRFRTNWNITVRVRTLRRTALLAVAEHIRYPSDVYELGLPWSLAEELSLLVAEANHVPTPELG